MVITGLTEYDKTKKKVWIDGEYAFWMTRKEIEEYDLKEGMELSASSYEKILEDTVLIHAKNKALSILKFRDRTEQELRLKLTEASFSTDIIHQVIEYVKSYSYLDDARFTMAYIKSRKGIKSKLAIKTELLQKGINRELLRQVMDIEYEEREEEEDAELSAIRKAIQKKKKAVRDMSPEERQKLMASLYRKGFEIRKINEVLNE